MKLININKRDLELQFYKRLFPVLFRKKNINPILKGTFFSQMDKLLESKKSISIVLSGPSAKNLKISENSFYFCTNNSYRLIKGSFLYFLSDPFFVYKYIYRNNFIRNESVVFFYPNTKFEKIKTWNTKISTIIQGVLERTESLNSEYLLSFINNPGDLLELETFFYDKLNWDGEFYNSGIILTMLACYFAQRNNLEVNLYGLDMGLGGTVHIDAKSSVFHPNFLSNENIKGVSQILFNIQNLIGSTFNNHSFFQLLKQKCH